MMARLSEAKYLQAVIPCNLCPRKCNVDRSVSQGWCKSDDRIHISSIVIHKGEEPPVSGEKGIVNVFFPSCNMQCIYCQNWEISCRGSQGSLMTLKEVCDAVIELLPLSENNLGFVSPTHFVQQMVMIVEEVRRRGYNPTIIYNSNGYDLPATLRSLEDTVDVWLPDFKYSDDILAEELSQAPGYSKYALASLKEMMHQTGATLYTDDRGIARRGIIVRHLVLPGFADNSIGVLKLIAEEVSTGLHLSLMSQYYPTLLLKGSYPQSGESKPEFIKPLLGTVSHAEYLPVIDAFYELGFTRGWLQEFGSQNTYRPDFSKKNPFE
jgi:putative pyruvate formate lyase activating enzyme